MEKMKPRQLKKKLNFFPIESFFVFFFKFLNIVYLERIQLSHSFYMKTLKIMN